MVSASNLQSMVLYAHRSCAVKFFSTAAVDNLDHNLTSATATDSFHGTGISFIQHLSHDAEEVDCGVMVINPNTSYSAISRSIVPLPWTNTNVPPMSVLERFVMLLYDQTSDLLQVNDARKQLFTKKSRTLESIPTTCSALKQHVKRASYQAFCWSLAIAPNPELPSPADGVGGKILLDNSHFGPPFRKQQNLVISLSTVAFRRDAVGDASV